MKKLYRFEVGHEYECADCGIDPIRVLKRTEKYIFVTNGTNEWRMKIREYNNTEYVMDSSFPKKWQDALAYYASLKCK